MKNLRKFAQRLDSAFKMYNGRFDFDNEDNVFLCGYGFLLNTDHCIYSIEQYLSNFKISECKEHLGFDIQLQKCKSRLFNYSRIVNDLEVHGTKSLDRYGYKYYDQTIATAHDMGLLIEANVKKIKVLLGELYNKVVLEASDKFFEEYYITFKKKVDSDFLKHEFDVWKMKNGELNIDILRELQTLVVADALKAGILKFERNPTKREMSQVQMDYLMSLLPFDYQLPANFDRTCAKFRRFSSWDDVILKLNYGLYGKYIFSNRRRLDYNIVMRFGEMDVRLELIHNEMIKLMQRAIPKSSILVSDADKYWQRLIEAGFVDNNHQLLSGTSRKQAMYIAELFADKLGLKSKWKYFEELWHINNLAQEKWDLQQNGAMPSRYKEINDIFAD